MFSLILSLIALVSSLLIIESSSDNAPYSTVYIRDLKINTYELEPKFANNPTSSSYDSTYTNYLYKHYEKLNKAKDKPIVNHKKTDKHAEIKTKDRPRVEHKTQEKNS